MGCCSSIFAWILGRNSELEGNPILNDENGNAEQQQVNEVLLRNENDNPVYFISPGVSRYLDQLTEDEQIEITRKIEFIGQMPSAVVSDQDKLQECVICMMDVEIGETIRYLPCAHMFHKDCVDVWLMRSLCCPTCMEEITEIKEYLSNLQMNPN